MFGTFFDTYQEARHWKPIVLAYRECSPGGLGGFTLTHTQLQKAAYIPLSSAPELDDATCTPRQWNAVPASVVCLLWASMSPTVGILRRVNMTISVLENASLAAYLRGNPSRNWAKSGILAVILRLRLLRSSPGTTHRAATRGAAEHRLRIDLCAAQTVPPPAFFGLRSGNSPATKHAFNMRSNRSGRFPATTFSAFSGMPSGPGALLFLMANTAAKAPVPKILEPVSPLLHPSSMISKEESVNDCRYRFLVTSCPQGFRPVSNTLSFSSMHQRCLPELCDLDRPPVSPAMISKGFRRGKDESQECCYMVESTRDSTPTLSLAFSLAVALTTRRQLPPRRRKRRTRSCSAAGSSA
ncbi:hypothetical protein J6590_052323 [Homalodisca vitripennis]|nr:hypothetical protein J6590_052323 [Homalodisca vitripennis]